MSETPQSTNLHEHAAGETVHLPAPTAWPFLMALGVVLIFSSLVMSPLLGVLGGVLTVAGIVGWFREVLPIEKHEDVLVEEHVYEHVPVRTQVAKIEVTKQHRAMLPLESFSFSSGILGGIVGGIAMVIPAEIYGVLRYHSIWYVVNLLGGAGVGGWLHPTVQQMSQFHLGAFVAANLIQGVTTLLVGTLYGALLPIWPRHPILLGGLIAPALWTGLLHSTLGLVNPFLDTHIDWWSFAASQVFFGLVAGFVVTRVGKINRLSQMPLAVRMGVEASGLHPEDDGSTENAGGGEE